jgi:hypothetical protein
VLTWTGTISAANVHATSDCNDPGTGAPDDEAITIQVPSQQYAGIDARFTFQIAWTPTSGDETTNDEILTVDGPDAADPGDTQSQEKGSSDGGATNETLVFHNLAPGTYHVLACGYNNVTPQPYTGTLTLDVASLTDTTLPSADPQGLTFSAAVPADPQRDEAEPLIEIDPAGNIYTCGPTGFGTASDYAQVSTDGGDQFHLLGTPPRGQQGFGGGGDCALATGIAKNSLGNYQYAYSGLGPLTGFTTSTSPDVGHSIGNGGPSGNGLPAVTSNGALADRQWMTFLDDHTVLLAYNQQQPRNVVVQKSTDGGLTYSPISSIAAPNPEFPGPMHYIPSLNVVYMPWTKGEEVNLAISKDGGTTWTDCVVATGDTVKGGTAGFAVADNDNAGNVYVVWADSDKYHTWMSALSADKLAGCNQAIAAVRKSAGGQPTVAPGFTAPVQVDRDGVRTTVFPWVAAGGAPGRVAVAFYGTTSDGDPNSGEFNAAWDVYVSQSLNAFDAGATFAQVKATTHPFHYDSICLNGLACDLSAPPGDRTLADFFAIDFSPATGKLSVVFDRTNKKPDDDLGRIATPMVVTQTAGPSNAGGFVALGRQVLRDSTDDPTGDALSNYSLTALGPPPPPPPTRNETAADFTSVTTGSQSATGNLVITLKLADLSAAALNAALLDAGAQSLEWVFRFTNGYTDSAASASWSPATGFKLGFDDYTLGGQQCVSTGEKCQIYPQAKAVDGSVNQSTGTIVLIVPHAYLRELRAPDPYGRPTEGQADIGSRFYDGTAFSFANNASATQDVQSYLEPLDGTAAMDFVLPNYLIATPPAAPVAPPAVTPPAATPPAAPPAAAPPESTPPATTAAPASGSGVAAVARVLRGHRVNGFGKIRVRATKRGSRGWVSFLTRNGTVRTAYWGGALRYHFRATKVTFVRFKGHTVSLRGRGIAAGKRVTFRITAVDRGRRDRYSIRLSSGYARSGTLIRGNITVK